MTLKLNGTTSGSVSIDAPATGSNISFTLPGSVGSSGQLLSTNGAGVLSFVNGGKILQVVRDTDTTSRTTTSTSATDVTGVSVTITPTAASSNILLIWAFYALAETSTGDEERSEYRITDSSNNTIDGALTLFGSTNVTQGGSLGFHGYLTIMGWASPNTTSAVTYKARFRSLSSNTTTYVRGDQNTTQLYAIEVAA